MMKHSQGTTDYGPAHAISRAGARLPLERESGIPLGNFCGPRTPEHSVGNHLCRGWYRLGATECRRFETRRLKISATCPCVVIKSSNSWGSGFQNVFCATSVLEVPQIFEFTYVFN